MNRTGLLIALAVAAVVGVVFGLSPELDIELSRPFHDPTRGGFWASLDPTFLLLRDVSRWIITLLVAPAVVALVLKFALPRRRAIMPLRAALFLVATLAMGPGVVANLLLKDNWSRPRPIDLVEFGGVEHFRPWWDPRGDCPANCSFVAGEPSGAFWTLAPASLAPMPWRAAAYAAALAFGGFVGALRLIAGGHFMSDILLGGVLMFLVIWTVHGAIYRWPRTRLTEEGIERWVVKANDRVRRLFGRRLPSADERP